MGPSSKPNILFILSDQHRFDWVGASGCSFVDTPHLDALAGRGLRFEKTYCSAPLCGPSRMSLLTGRHPYRNGVYINEHCLSSDTPTFVHSLGLAGYHTVLCGRMHFMGPDQRHGYQERLVGDICRCSPGGLAIDLGEFSGTTGNVKKAVKHARPGDSPVLAFDRDVTAGWEEYCENYGNEGKPLFATVGFYGPHHTFSAPPAYYEKAKSAMKKHDTINNFNGQPAHPWLAERIKRTGEKDITLEAATEARINYAAMISYLDSLIGRVLKAAEKLPGETLVIYTSDHGEMAGDHHMFGKGNHFDASQCVPLICAPLHETVSGFHANAGTVVSYPVSLLDISPTVTEFAGEKPLRVQDGKSLVPFFKGASVEEEEWKNRSIFAEHEILRREPSRMIVKGSWKLIYYYGYEDVELYNLDIDPQEKENRGFDPSLKSLKAALMDELLADWDGEAIYKDQLGKMDDLEFMTRWGREVGMDKLDAWGDKMVAR